MSSKLRSQIGIALVCAILGFMLTYQFKAFMRQEKIFNISSTTGTTDITVEIEQYKKQKAELEEKVNELQSKLDAYEKAATEENDVSKAVLAELENARLYTGFYDVHGPGVVIYLDPSTDLFGSSSGEHITDKHLVYLINELRFAGAEAISINDIRITGLTGIRNAGNYILINDNEKVSFSKRITIKAIGNKDLLYSALNFPEVFSDFRGICTVKYEKSDDIKISKYSKPFTFEYAKPVK